jgi:hypothetical protein
MLALIGLSCARSGAMAKPAPANPTASDILEKQLMV